MSFFMIRKAMSAYWRLRKSEDAREATRHHAEADEKSLRNFEQGRFYPIMAEGSGTVIPSKYFLYPPLSSEQDRIRNMGEPPRLSDEAKRHGYWLGKFGPNGRVFVRISKQPYGKVPNFSRSDFDPDEGEHLWGWDHVHDPNAHADLSYIYGHPDDPEVGSLQNPETHEEIFNALRSLGIKSISYTPLRESQSSDPLISGRPDRGIQRAIAFTPLLHNWHERVAREIGYHPLQALDKLPTATRPGGAAKYAGPMPSSGASVEFPKGIRHPDKRAFPDPTSGTDIQQRQLALRAIELQEARLRNPDAADRVLRGRGRGSRSMRGAVSAGGAKRIY